MNNSIFSMYNPRSNPSSPAISCTSGSVTLTRFFFYWVFSKNSRFFSKKKQDWVNVLAKETISFCPNIISNHDSIVPMLISLKSVSHSLVWFFQLISFFLHYKISCFIKYGPNIRIHYIFKFGLHCWASWADHSCQGCARRYLEI